jgi:hypothetical protein
VIILMKKIFLLIPVLLAFISCKKEINRPDTISGETIPTIAKNQGYIQIKCESCIIGYGMPDQYKAFNNANGTSLKFPYSYSEGYSLQAYITALDHEQKLTVSVYDTNAKLIYESDKLQPTTNYWAIAVLLPSVTN